MKELLSSLDRLEKLANGSRLKRFLFRPYSYVEAIAYRSLIYPSYSKPLSRITKTFFGKSMEIALPSATDIYLTGGKTHSSEIRLARFIISKFNAETIFIDIGAHYGYFSLLAAEIIGLKGKVFAFEASPDTFSLLQANTRNEEKIQIFNTAVSDTLDQITFFQFPALYSEYNSSDITGYEKERWFKNHPPQKLVVDAITIDKFVKEYGVKPNFIKIDVEGSEYNVVKGAIETLEKYPVVVVMEYLADTNKNLPHRNATEFLLTVGYKPYVITREGSVMPVESIERYLSSGNIDSENIVFDKSTINL